MHASEAEARQETLRMLDIYDKTGRDLLAIPFVKGRKTEKEKFAGALETYTIEALMHDGKALQSGTTHYFGDGFAKAFGVQYLDKDGKIKNPYQTSWGVSTRLLGSIIMVHGDDNGLVLPPFVAPIQVVIVPIKMNEPGVLAKAREVKEQLEEAGIRVKLDESDKTPGWKFSEYEMKGVPLRVEIGPKDLANGTCMISKRNDGTKERYELENIVSICNDLFKKVHKEMYDKAMHHLLSNIHEVKTYDEFKEVIEKGGYCKMMWCGDVECENKIKDDTNATSRCIPFDQLAFSDTCPVCGKKAKYSVYFAKAY